MSVKFFQPQALRKYNPPDKYSNTYDADTYIFHIDKIYTAPKQTVVDSKFKQLPIWKIITGKWTSGEFQFEHTEFIIAFFSLEFTLFNMMRYIDFMKYAGGKGIMVNILLSIIIPMPIVIYYTFISMYSRTGFIKFWNYLPIGKGFAYSYIVYKTMTCIVNAPLCGVILWYILKIIVRNPLLFGKNIENYANSLAKYEIGCNNTFTNRSAYGAIKYFRNQFNYGDSNDNFKKTFFLRWWLLTVVVWIIIYITMLCTFRRIYKMMHKITIFLLIIVFIPVTLYMIYVNRNLNFHVYNEANLGEPEVWMQMGSFLLQGILPGTYMTFAAVTKPGLIPEVAILWIYIMKSFLFCVTSIIASLVQEQVHWIETGSTDCIVRFSGIEMVVATIPELLVVYPIGGYILVLYFIGLFYWSVCSIIYEIHGLLETVFITFPKLTKFRLFICTGLFFFACLVTATMFVSNVYFRIFTTAKDDALAFYTYFMVILMISSILIYSIRRYENDYFFDYSRRLRPIVKCGIQFSIIFCIPVIILYVLYGLPHMDFSQQFNILVNLMAFVTVSPIMIYIGITLYQNRGEKRQPLLKPSPIWGPEKLDRKQNRRRCDPAREFKYMVYLPCTHMCLQDSKSLNSELEFWRARLKYFISLKTDTDEYEEEHDHDHRVSFKKTKVK